MKYQRHAKAGGAFPAFDATGELLHEECNLLGIVFCKLINMIQVLF